ncbi:hypothetical protein BGZ46_006894 [Entomortierella lignicola]|nr:hypothetical protein BGZ46_006894 [Entomortierella lignicola]
MAVPTLPQVEEVIQQFYTSQDPGYQKSAQDYLHNLQKETFAWELAPHLLSSQNENSQFFGAHTYQVKISRDWARVNQSVDGVVMPQQAMELTLLEFFTIIAEEIGRADIEPTRRAQLSNEVSNGIPLIMSCIREILMGSNNTSKQKALVCFKSWVQYGVAFDIIQPILGLVLNSLLDNETFDSAAEVWSEIMSSNAAAKYQNTICEGLIPCFASDWARAKHLESIEAESEDMGKSLCQLLSTFGDNFSDWIAARFLRPDIVIYLEMMMGFAGFPGYYAEDEEISDLTLNFWYVLQESLSELQPDDSEDHTGRNANRESFDEDRHVVLSSISSASSIVGLSKQSLQTIKEASIQVYIKLTEVLRKKLEYPVQREWMTWARDIRQEFTGHRQEIADTLINSYHVLHDQILAILIDTCALQLDEIQSASLSGANTPDNLRLEIGLVQLEATLYCLKALSEVVPHTENLQMPRFFSEQIFGRLPKNFVCRACETALSLIGSYADWFKVHPQYLLPALNFVIPALEIPQLAPSAAKALKNICDTCRESLVEAIDAFMTVFANVERAIDPAIKGSVVYSIATVIQTLPVERSIGPLVGLLGDIFTRSNECLETRKQRLASGNSNIIATHHQTANGETELEPVTAMMLQQLDFLLSCCRGLQSPLEDEIRTAHERIITYQRTVEDRARILSAGGMTVELARSMEQVIQGVIMVWPHEQQIIERVCQIIKSMMTASQLSPLYLPFTSLIRVIENGFQQHSFSCWLDASAKAVSVYYFETTGGALASRLGSGSAPNSYISGPGSTTHSGIPNSTQVINLDSHSSPPANMVERERTTMELENEAVFTHLLTILVGRTLEGMKSTADMEEHPDVVHSFFAVLSQFVRHAPLAFYSIPPEQTESLMNFSIAGLALQERLALKATLLFLLLRKVLQVEFVNQNCDYTGLKQRVDELMVRIGPQMLRGILLGIGGQVPRSMVPQLNDTLYPLVGKYSQECRTWIQTLLAEPGFPSKYADQASKEKFVKGIMQ